jgi:phthiodiolone/phenolphthiodiolone dimycocerosates ketoreductase
VRYIVLVNASVMQRSLRKALASAMPFNKVVRGIKKL